jgi:hemoglobin
MGSGSARTRFYDDPVSNDDPSGQTVYEAVGGMPFFEGLVDRFYAGVADDPVLLPLYPEQDDLGPAKERLTLFLAQYWGGPTTYSDGRGHPRLRMRHAPFAIGVAERDAWLHRMHDALATAEGLDSDLVDRMTEYFAMAADHLINRP